MKRYNITVGAATTAGGKVITGNSSHVLDGVPAAYEGDKCSCPACGSEGVIALDGPRLSETWDGREVALSDDLCICKCSPPPRLIAAQDRVYQIVDSDWLASEGAARALAASKLNTAGSSAATAVEGIPLVLLNPETDEPYKHRRYKVELRDAVIEGTTDQHGATRPLTAAERAAVVRWHVENENAPA